MSVLRNVIVALVGVLCFSVNIYGQYSVRATYDEGSSRGSSSPCGTAYKIQIDGDNVFHNGFCIYNGNNRMREIYTGYDLRNLVKAVDNGSNYGLRPSSNSSSTIHGWLNLDVVNKTLIYTDGEPDCGIQVPDIAGGADHVCYETNNGSHKFADLTEPDFSSSPYASKSYPDRGWLNVTTGETFATLDAMQPYTDHYGETLCYYVKDGERIGYSNEVTLASLPDVVVGTMTYCQNMPITEFPEIKSFDAHGSAITTQYWRIYNRETKKYETYTNQLVTKDKYDYILAYTMENQCGSLGIGTSWSQSRSYYKTYSIPDAPVVEDVYVSNGAGVTLPDFKGRYKLSSSDNWTEFMPGDKTNALSCSPGTYEYTIEQYDEHGCASNPATFTAKVGVSIDKETNMGIVNSCSNASKELKVEASTCNGTVVYQWYKNGMAISGATSSAYTPTESGEYYCVVKTAGDDAYSVQSSTADVTLVSPATVSLKSVSPSGSSIFCTETVDMVLEIKDENGKDITSSVRKVYWTKNGAVESLTAATSHSFAFSDSESGSFTVGAYLTDPNGCEATLTTPKTVTVGNNYTTYYYCGNTGDASDLTKLSNWHTNENGTGASPTSFSNAHCKYIINKDGVKLKSGQMWNVSGVGSKVIVGDGIWRNSLPNVGSFSNLTNWGEIPSGTYAEYLNSTTGAKWVSTVSSVANYDFRSYAKELTIEGVFNTDDDVKIDVREGATLTIATDQGSFKIGDIATDRLISRGGNSDGYYNVIISPGASVTYKNSGVKNIRTGTYSQLYIDATGQSNIVMEKDATIEIKQSFVATPGGSDNLWMRDRVNTNNSTFIYSGNANQTVIRFRYNNLVIKGSSKKNLNSAVWTNTVEVDVSANMQLDAYCSLYIYGSGEAFVNKGNVKCVNASMVAYLSASSTSVAPINYGKLDLSTGERIFSKIGITGISNTLTVGTATPVTTGSTIEFNGTSAQTIPAFDFYNLNINNKGLDGSKNDKVSLAGNINVAGNLSLIEGVLNTNGKTLTVTNSEVGAVSQGYRINADSASYIEGGLTRTLPSNSSGTTGSYIYPVGTADAYMPLTMQGITTGADASATVSITTSPKGTGKNSPLTALNTSGYWKIDGADYVSSSISVSTSAGLNGSNTLGFERKNSSSFDNILGCSVSSNAITASSVVEGDGYIALATRNINAKTYYYNCNNTTNDITNVNSWWTGQYASGSHPTSFIEDDATWIIDCGTTISKDLTIGGSNTKVQFNIKSGDVLTINANVALPIVEHKQGRFEIGRQGELSILNNFSINDQSSEHSNRPTIINDGKLTVYNSNLEIKSGIVKNNGEMNFYNTDVTMTSELDGTGDWNLQHRAHTQFFNNGVIRMNTGGLTVTGRYVHVVNEAGAVWLVDNTAAQSKKVIFGTKANGVEFSDIDDRLYVDFKCGSSFVVKHSDVDVLYLGNIEGTGNAAFLNGEFVVYDGNMLVKRSTDGGGKFTLSDCGEIYMVDTDDSGDGIFEVSGASGWEVNVEGTLYANGIMNTGNGNGNKFNVKDGAEIFVGDIGVGSSSDKTWSFSLDVKSGGTMNYCGNRTSGGDGIGENAGTLNYAGSFYEGSSPMTEGDISGEGTQNIMFVDGNDCMAAYVDVATHNTGSTLLPIELTMIYGICKENVVEIHWQTVSETGNEVFEVLRSFDGVNFEEIGSLLGAGTTTDVQNYVYFDTDEDKTGIVYYKLRQVDFDKKSVESKIIAVQTCGKNAQISVAPDEIFVQFKNPETANYVVITTLSGQIIYSKTFNNVDEARIAAPRTKGIYIISVIDNKQITSEKFIK